MPTYNQQNAESLNKLKKRHSTTSEGERPLQFETLKRMVQMNLLDHLRSMGIDTERLARAWGFDDLRSI